MILLVPVETSSLVLTSACGHVRENTTNILVGEWFGTFFIFHHILNNNPN